MAPEPVPSHSSGYNSRPPWQWIILYLLMGVIVYGVIYYFFTAKQNKGGYNYQNPTSAPTSQTSALNRVTIKNFSFDPLAIRVKAGTTITWVNQDSASHTVDSDIFHSPALNTGDKFTYTFNSKGNFNYHCGLHPAMTATVSVE